MEDLFNMLTSAARIDKSKRKKRKVPSSSNYTSNNNSAVALPPHQIKKMEIVNRML
jgi:hypothetical protein